MLLHFSLLLITLICGCGGIGSFAPSASCGGYSECAKGAAVEILHRSKVQKISGTARVTHAAALGNYIMRVWRNWQTHQP